MSNQINELVTKIVESAVLADNPAHRVVKEIKIVPSTHCKYEGVYDILCSSTDEWGFTEEEDKYLYSTCIYTPENIPAYTVDMSLLDFIMTLPSDFDELDKALTLLGEKPEYSYECESDGLHYYRSQNDNLVDYAEDLACGLFITGQGGCNWENIWKFKDRGYDIFAGEKDSFGWLSGCIQKDDGPILVYG